MISSSKNAGNVLFLILIAVALFAALSYAVTSSSRSGTGSTTKEKAQLSQGVIDSYTSAINAGTLRLQMRGCTSIDYTPPAGWGAEDHKCHLFHPDGGGVIYQNISLGDGVCSNNASPWTSLTPGAGCDGIIYMGTNGGNRIYTTSSDQGAYAWSSSAVITTGANSDTNGMANTNNLVGRSDATYAPAGACRALGPKWYWPARSELDFMWPTVT